MDFREHEDDFRQPGGHWGSSVCLDYLEVWTDKQKSKAKLCGTWDVANDRLTTHGSNQVWISLFVCTRLFFSLQGSRQKCCRPS
jgi:hypothetical protein